MFLYFHIGIIFVTLHLNTNIMQCCFGVNSFAVDAIFEHILLYNCDKKHNNNIVNADTNNNDNSNDNNIHL